MSKTKWTITKLVIVVIVIFPILYKVVNWFKDITSTKMLNVLLIYYKSIGEEKAAESISDVTNYFATISTFVEVFLFLLLFIIIMPIVYFILRMRNKNNMQHVRDLGIYFLTIFFLYLTILLASLSYISFSPFVLNIDFIPIVSQFVMAVMLAFFFTGFSLADRLSNKVFKRIRKENLMNEEEVNRKKDSKKIVVLLFSIVVLLVINSVMVKSSIEMFSENREQLTVPDRLILNDETKFTEYGKSCTNWIINCSDDRTQLFSYYTLEKVSILIENETLKSLLMTDNYILIVMIRVNEPRYVNIKREDITLTETGHTLTYEIDFTNYVTQEMKETGFSEVLVYFNDVNTERYHDPIHYWKEFEITLRKINND